MIDINGLEDFDMADYIKTDEQALDYIAAVLDDDPALLPAALRVVARARGGMTELAHRTGLSREALYRSLKEGSDPRYSTICKIMKAYGAPLGQKRETVTA